MSSGRSRIHSASVGTKTMTEAATASDITRHPAVLTIAAMVGRKISWPAALAAVRMPTTSPSRVRNQRAAMNAAR